MWRPTSEELPVLFVVVYDVKAVAVQHRWGLEYNTIDRTVGLMDILHVSVIVEDVDSRRKYVSLLIEPYNAMLVGICFSEREAVQL